MVFFEAQLSVYIWYVQVVVHVSPEASKQFLQLRLSKKRVSLATCCRRLSTCMQLTVTIMRRAHICGPRVAKLKWAQPPIFVVCNILLNHLK